MTDPTRPTSSAGGMASTTQTSEPLTREALWKRIRASSHNEVVLEEMVRLGFWPPADALPNNPAQEMQQEAQLRAELKALLTERAKLENPERLRRQIRMERFAASREKQKANRERRLAEREARARAWQQTKRTDLPYLGDGVSGGLGEKGSDREKLLEQGLPALHDAGELAAFFGISVGELRFLSFHRRVSKTTHYQRFTVPKKTGGMRHISAPMPRLKGLQRRLLDDVLVKVPLHDAAHGFRRDRTIVTGALPHLNAPVVINLDLKNFFPTVTYRRVKGVFRSLGYGEQVSTVMALLCTEPEVTELMLDGERWYVHRSERRLPQGSPASPQITNILCRRLDAQLTKVAEALGFIYTRYADDLSFSYRGDAAEVARGLDEGDVSGETVRKLLGRVRFVVEQAGFQVHPDKTRVMRKGRRREVTGIVVNDDRPRVDKRKLKQARAALHHLKTKGLAGAHFAAARADDGDDVVAALEGYASFVLMVDRERGERLRQTLAEVCAERALQRRPTPRTGRPGGPRYQRHEDGPEVEAASGPPDAGQPSEASTERISTSKGAGRVHRQPRPTEDEPAAKPWWKFW